MPMEVNGSASHDRLIGPREVCEIIGKGDTWLRDAVVRGDFPESVPRDNPLTRRQWWLSTVRGWAPKPDSQPTAAQAADDDLDDDAEIHGALEQSRQVRADTPRIEAAIAEEAAAIVAEIEKLAVQLEPIRACRKRRAELSEKRRQYEKDAKAGQPDAAALALLQAEERRLVAQEQRAIEASAPINESIEDLTLLRSSMARPAWEHYGKRAALKARARRLVTVGIERTAFRYLQKFRDAYLLAYVCSIWADEIPQSAEYTHKPVRRLPGPSPIDVGRVVANEPDSDLFTDGAARLRFSAADLIGARAQLMERVAALGFGPED